MTTMRTGGNTNGVMDINLARDVEAGRQCILMEAVAAIAAAEVGAPRALDQGEIALSDREFARIKARVYEVAGISLSDAKRTLVVSRLSKVVRALKLSSFDAYLDYLETKGSEDDKKEDKKEEELRQREKKEIISVTKQEEKDFEYNFKTKEYTMVLVKNNGEWEIQEIYDDKKEDLRHLWKEAHELNLIFSASRKKAQQNQSSQKLESPHSDI